MNSKRDLKRQIRYICGDLVGECMLLGEIVADDKQDEVAQLIIDLAVLQENTISHASFAFDKSRRDFQSAADYNKARAAYHRAAFATLHREFNTAIADCLHRMNQLAGLAKKD